jgi:hypothetical protein
MSARVESPPIGGGTLGGSFVIAVIVALSIGVFLGSLVTYAIDRDGGTSSFTFVARGTPASTAADVGNGTKAFEGPMPAEQFRSEAGSAVVWDAGKLEAMGGRQLAEQFRSEAGSAVVWDAGKLDAMEGRQLAEERRHRPHGGPLG